MATSELIGLACHQMRVLVAGLMVALILLGPSPARAQLPSCGVLPASLLRLGPARMVESDGGRWLVYEDRISRQPLRAALGLADKEREFMERCGVDGLSSQRFGLRLPTVRSDGSVVPLHDVPRLSRAASGVHMDLEVELLYNFAIDYPKDWFRDRIALGPKLKLWWPNGLVMSAQVALPIRNQLPERHAEYWSKPYINVLMAGFRRQLAPGWVGAVSVGFYERNRYGSDLQLYWMSDRWPIVLGGRAGMSGYWSFYEGELETGPLDMFTGYMDATVYLPWHNIRLRGRGGQFIREIGQFRRPGEDVKRNPGVSGEVTRMFGEVEIGLHAFYDGFVMYPGFRFAVPLSPKRGVRNGRLAVYPTRQHYVPYDLGRVVRGKNTGFVRPLRGELHRTDVDIWGDLRMLAPEMAERFR